jgi:hypothetical protein
MLTFCIVLISLLALVDSKFEIGCTHTQTSCDSWDNPTAVSRAKNLLKSGIHFQNQHIMGWGADNPEPAPNYYNWGSLDARVSIMRETSATPVITLCCSPDWMKGGKVNQTDWSKLEVAPLPQHYQDFANLAKEVAKRYPDVVHFQVWNELKGFWDSAHNRWSYENYTRLYNLVYDELKSVNSAILVGCPYVVMDKWSTDKVAPSKVRGPYGIVDQRSLDVVTYWLKNKHGAEFVTVDGGTTTKDKGLITDEYNATQVFSDVNTWLSQQSSLPIWWAEFYAIPDTGESWTAQHQADVFNRAQQEAGKLGTLILTWPAQGGPGWNRESMWSDTDSASGGQSTLIYNIAKNINFS